MLTDGWTIASVGKQQMTFLSEGRTIVAPQRRRMWYLKAVPKSMEEETVTAFATMEQRISTIHESFAHLALARMKEAVAAGTMKAFPSDVRDAIAKAKSINCMSCVQGKTKIKSLPKGYGHVPRMAGELVYSDNCGPFPKQSGGGHYLCIFVDDATRMVFLFRSDTLDASSLVRHTRTVNIFLGTRTRDASRIVALQADNGSDYASAEFGKFCNDNGILLRFAIPYSHQNGVPEKWWDYINTTATAMIVCSGMGKEFHFYAAMMFVAVINSESTGSTHSARDLFFRRRHDMPHRMPFGSLVLALVPMPLRRKSVLDRHTGSSCLVMRIPRMDTFSWTSARSE